MKKRYFLLFLLANLALSLQTARADNDSFNVQFIGTIVGSPATSTQAALSRRSNSVTLPQMISRRLAPQRRIQSLISR